MRQFTLKLDNSTQNTQNTQIGINAVIKLMNKQQFQAIIEKFNKAHAKAKVLRLLLDGLTNAEIAKLRKRREGTVRKQISNIYKDFGIKSEFPGDQAQRDKLIALFCQYKPEWVSNNFSISIDEKKNHLENISNNDAIPLFPEVEKDLISLAISTLNKIGFTEIFQMKIKSNVVGYKPKRNLTTDKRYQIFIEDSSDSGLIISINKKILESHLLNLKYWIDIGDGNWNQEIVGRLLVIPGKENLFLSSLQPKYWNILEVEGKTVGDVYLNDKENPEYYDHTTQETTKKCVEGFNEYDLSNTESYIVINENQEFSFKYTWQMFIKSREVLQDFIVYFGDKLMKIQSGETSDDEIHF